MCQRHDIDTRELNCAARFHGVSLNDCLLSGPNLENTITGTLLRFRHHGVAIIGDIESRFYQVRVPEKEVRSKESVASIPCTDSAKETVNLDLEQDDLPTESS